MYNGKHSRAPKQITVRKKRKTQKGGLAAVLILAVIVLGCAATVAYLTSTTENLKNTFTPSKVDSEVVEEGLTSASKPSATVQNIGDTYAFIRVVVIGNEINGDGEIIDSYDVSSFLKADGTDLWTKNGAYYYYGSVVAPGDFTSNIIKSAIPLLQDGKRYQVIIQSEAIQAEPFTPEGYGKPANEAWGVNISSDGTLTIG